MSDVERNKQVWVNVKKGKNELVIFPLCYYLMCWWYCNTAIINKATIIARRHRHGSDSTRKRQFPSLFTTEFLNVHFLEQMLELFGWNLLIEFSYFFWRMETKKKKEFPCRKSRAVFSRRQAERQMHTLVCPSEVYIEQQCRVWCEPQGPTRVESCNDTPCNTSDSHFENISTIYHTPNHPLSVCVCAVWWEQNDSLNITSIFICVWMCVGSVYDYILNGERKMCECVCPSGTGRVCVAIMTVKNLYGGNMGNREWGGYPAPAPRKRKEEISIPPPPQLPAPY